MEDKDDCVMISWLSFVITMASTYVINIIILEPVGSYMIGLCWIYDTSFVFPTVWWFDFHIHMHSSTLTVFIN